MTADAGQIDASGFGQELLVELSTQHGRSPHHLQGLAVEAAQATAESGDRPRDRIDDRR